MPPRWLSGFSPSGDKPLLLEILLTCLLGRQKHAQPEGWVASPLRGISHTSSKSYWHVYSFGKNMATQRLRLIFGTSHSSSKPYWHVHLLSIDMSIHWAKTCPPSGGVPSPLRGTRHSSSKPHWHVHLLPIDISTHWAKIFTQKLTRFSFRPSDFSSKPY